MNETFMTVEDHFNALLLSSAQDVQDVFAECRHNRVETAYRGRNFVIYQMNGREPEILDRFTVNDVVADDIDGVTAEITSTRTKKTMVLGYSPKKLFQFPVLSWVPLHTKLRWGAPASTPMKGSLGFPITLRTMSRYHLRERGVVYCETAKTFAEEFESTEV